MVYYYSFPSDERESELIILKSILTQRGIVFALKDGTVTKGIASVHLFKDVPMAFLVYFALAPSLQRKGIGSRFLRYIEDCCMNHYLSVAGRYDGMVWEVKKDPENAADSWGLPFFQKNGGVLLPCPYIQPPVDGKNPVEMYLMYKGDRDLPLSHPNLIRHIYFDKYSNVNEIDTPVLESLYQSVTKTGL